MARRIGCAAVVASVVVLFAAGHADTAQASRQPVLARSSNTADELVTWMKVTVDVCVNRTARGPSTTIFQAPPAPSPTPTACRPRAGGSAAACSCLGTGCPGTP